MTKRAFPMLDGKLTFISGAASGIGRAAALLFHSYGARLVLADIDAEGLGRTAALVREGGGEAAAFTLDVADYDAVDAVFEKIDREFGPLDAAFNNAGVEGAGGRMVPTQSYSRDAFDDVLRVNARGVFACMQAELRSFTASGQKGAIVNTASVMGLWGQPGMIGYCVSKHAVVGATRTAALEAAPAGVRVNAICPGAVATPMLTERGFVQNPEFAEAAAGVHPMKRIAEASEVAEAAAWLLSDKASFITGCALPVDGGLSAG